jgi:hypothetical protein
VPKRRQKLLQNITIWQARQMGDGLTSIRRGITPLSGSRHIAFTGSGEGYVGCRD